jgi:hypothetical protein
MRIQLERFLALAAGSLVAAGLAAGCTASSGDDGGSAGANWLTTSGGRAATATGGVTAIAGGGGVATGGTAGAAVTGGTAGAAAGGTATGGTAGTAACYGDTTLSTTPPGCADLPYTGYCANIDTLPGSYSLCLDYETVGVTRPGVMEQLVACMQETLPADAASACADSSTAIAWACVAGVEQLACDAATSTSFCEDVVAACSEITAAACDRAFNTLTPTAGNAAANCMMGYADPGCGQDAWDNCFPTRP